MTILAPPAAGFKGTAEIVVIGAGACGMVAALAAEGDGGEVVVLERDAVPSGSTALSSGLIPACATAAQKARGVKDDASTSPNSMREGRSTRRQRQRIDVPGQHASSDASKD